MMTLDSDMAVEWEVGQDSEALGIWASAPLDSRVRIHRVRVHCPSAYVKRKTTAGVHLSGLRSSGPARHSILLSILRAPPGLSPQGPL